jgi:5,10-methenyltetrahydromethanopterin hydrogenase
MIMAAQEILTRIEDLMEETGIDTIGVFEHVILETQRGFNLNTVDLLSWIPADFLPEILQWLEERRAEMEEPEEEV